MSGQERASTEGSAEFAQMEHEATFGRGVFYIQIILPNGLKWAGTGEMLDDLLEEVRDFAARHAGDDGR